MGALLALLVVSASGRLSAASPQARYPVPATPSVSGLPLAALQARLTGVVSPDTTLELDIGLPINQQRLTQVAQDIYNPSSSSYGHYLRPAQIARQFGASNATIRKVSSWLTGQGFQIVSASPLRTNLVVRASAAHIAKAFRVLLQTRSLDGQSFFGPSAAPTLPSAIAPLITSITGLTNFSHIGLTASMPIMHTPTGRASSPVQSSAGDCTLYGVLGGVTRNTVAQAYSIDQLYKAGYEGDGMKVAVVELGDTYSRDDVANYAACNGDQLHLSNVQVDNPLPAGSGSGEATLDLEMVAGLAPNAEILDYQTTQADNIGFLNSLNKIAADDEVQTVSVSYGAGEDQFDAGFMSEFNQTLEVLAVEGISVFVSSGDCAAFTDGVFGQLVVDFPASAPWAIGVGGTTLQGNTEIAWSQANPDKTRCQNTWGTGGGLSKDKSFTRPSWQTGSGVQNSYSNGERQVPDVSALADNISIYFQSFWQPVGGTSASAPIWAAGAALVDQALQKEGKPLLGGVPNLYAIANHPGQYHPFQDVTQGNNLYYQAGPGWDYPTGLGTPDFLDIAHALGVTF